MGEVPVQLDGLCSGRPSSISGIVLLSLRYSHAWPRYGAGGVKALVGDCSCGAASGTGKALGPLQHSQDWAAHGLRNKAEDCLIFTRVCFAKCPSDMHVGRLGPSRSEQGCGLTPDAAQEAGPESCRGRWLQRQATRCSQ